MPEGLESALYGVGMGIANNTFGIINGKISRRENFEYGEKAANNADARTRALYNDLYSIPAQMQQLKKAGLSPSLFYGQAGGISGQTGAQGTGASGVQNPTFGVDPMTLAQIKLMQAQTLKTNAETENTQKETELKTIESKFKNIDFTLHNLDFKLLTTNLTDKNGNSQSLAELASTCENYEEFTKKYDEISGVSHTTEQEQKTLREIFTANKIVSKNVAVLSNETINANFISEITNALANEDYAKLNANAAVGYLRTQIQTNSLTEQEKGAWNDLLKTLEEKNPTYKQIAIILGSIINRYIGQMNLNVGTRTTNVTGGTNNKTTHVLQ